MITEARGSTRTYFVHAGILAAAAVGSSFLPDAYRLGRWVPFHVGFTGAAVLGVVGATLFFEATLRQAPLPGSVVRIAHIGWHEASVASLVAGRITGWDVLVAVGGGGFFGSLLWAAGLIVWQSIRSGSKRWATQPAAYVAALASVGAGSVLGILLASGTAVTGGLEAHMVLNLLGFFGLVVLGTLPRFAPMLLRVRMRDELWTDVPWIVLGAGTAMTAYGAMTQAWRIETLGLWLGTAAAVAGLGLAVDTRVRSRIGLEPDGVHVLGALVWFTGVWGWLALDGDASTLSRFVQALVAGFLVQVFMGALSYFVPALQPGASSDRRSARAIMSRGWAIRLLLVNGGAVMLLFPSTGAFGWGLVLAAGASFAVLTERSVAVGRG